MGLLRIRAVARKEWIQIRRDRLSLAMAFLLPVMLLLIYAYAITFDVNEILMVVYDQDKSSVSRESRQSSPDRTTSPSWPPSTPMSR